LLRYIGLAPPNLTASALEKVRQRFPQYSDLSDDQFAHGLHRGFYGDLPFEVFAAKFGYTREPLR